MREKESKRITKRIGKAYPDHFKGTQVHSEVIAPNNRTWTVGTQTDTYRYHFVKDRKVVHRGMTDDLERREQEHRQKHGSGHIVQVGRRTTRDAARKWEHKGGKGD